MGPRAIRAVDGPPMGGFTGVLQAEHNLLAHLQELPTVLNLRRVAHTQRQVAALAAEALGGDHPDLVASWSHRAEVYAELGRRLRNIDGLAGDGGQAAAESANALTRLRGLHGRARSDRDLQRLDRLFTAVDRRIVDAVRTGAAERIYFARARLPRIDLDDGQPAHQTRKRFRPMPATESTQLVDILAPRRASAEQPMVHRTSGAAGAGIDGPSL